MEYVSDSVKPILKLDSAEAFTMEYLLSIIHHDDLPYWWQLEHKHFQQEYRWKEVVIAGFLKSGYSACPAGNVQSSQGVLSMTVRPLGNLARRFGPYS